MTRLRRVVVPGLPHDITQTGNRRANVFLDRAKEGVPKKTRRRVRRPRIFLV